MYSNIFIFERNIKNQKVVILAFKNVIGFRNYFPLASLPLKKRYPVSFYPHVIISKFLATAIISTLLSNQQFQIYFTFRI